MQRPHDEFSGVEPAPRAEVLGLRVDALTLGDAVRLIETWAEGDRSRWVVTLNPEMVMHAQKDPWFRGVLEKSDLVTADGVGIVWAARDAQGGRVPGRVSGIDLVEELLAAGPDRGIRFFFLGARPGVAEMAARRSEIRHPGLVIAGTHHGYFGQDEEGDVAAAVKAAEPDVIFVALGSPRQEEFIDRYLAFIGRGVAIGVGGSLDVLAGVVKRAPRWIQTLRLEWLYRIAAPSRWGRAMALPRFVLRVLRERKG